MGVKKLSENNTISFQEKVEFLKRVSIFTDIKENQSALEKIAHALKEKKFKAGEYILSIGPSDLCMYMLFEGRAEVLKETISGDMFHIADLKDSDSPVMGEGVLLHDTDRKSAIKAVETCNCLYIHKNDFEEFYISYPALAAPIIMSIAKSLSRRLKKQSDDFFMIYNALVKEIRGQD